MHSKPIKPFKFKFIPSVNITLKVFWSSQNGSFVFNQIFVYGTLICVDYKSEKKI